MDTRPYWTRAKEAIRLLDEGRASFRHNDGGTRRPTPLYYIQPEERCEQQNSNLADDSSAKENSDSGSADKDTISG